MASTFSRKHYVALAVLLHGELDKYRSENPDPDYHMALIQFARVMADRFERDSDKFNRAEFLAACGWGC